MTRIFEGTLPEPIIDAGIARTLEREIIPVTFREIMDVSPGAFEALTRWMPDARECATVEVFQVMHAADGHEYEVQITRRTPVITTFNGPRTSAPERQPWWSYLDVRFNPYMFTVRNPNAFFFIPEIS